LKHGAEFDVELATMAVARLHNFTLPVMDAPTVHEESQFSSALERDIALVLE
jgi:hypothetical protein